MWDPSPLNYREDWVCGSQCAASGGITTIVDMPLSVPPVVDHEGFVLKRNVAEQASCVDFAFWGGLTPGCVDSLAELDALGCVAYKGFMSFANPDYPQITDGYLVRGMRNAAAFGGLIGVHAENAEIADFGSREMAARLGADPTLHDEARPWWAELEAIHSVCRTYGMYLFVDGARLGYGLGAEGNDVTVRDLAALADAFYFGGTKCGAMFGEAVVLTADALKPRFKAYMKQNGAVLAKGWLLGAQFCALLEDGLSLGSGDGKRFHTVIPGTWESPADGSPVRWHTGDPETDPWEWRMRVLEERDDIAYAKLFFRTSGYIAWPLYPLFYAVRRRGESLEEAYRRGTVSGAAKRIYDVLAASGGVPLHDLKLLGRFSKGEKSAFDRALTDLQSRMFITVCGREQKRDKNGRAYGWSSTVFTTVEDFWAVRGRSLGKEDPERAYAVLLARLRTLRPDLEPSRAEKALRG